MLILVANRLQTTVCRLSKRFFLVSIIFLLLSIVSGQSSIARSETPLEKARQDYTFQLTKYEDAKAPYESARSNYLTFQTAISKNEAFMKTQEYLLTTCNVYTAYLHLIEERTNLHDWGKSSYNKDEIQKNLDQQINSIENLKSRIGETKTLEEAISAAQDLKAHIESKTLPTAFLVLSTTDIVQSQEVFFDFKNSADEVDKYATSKVTESNKVILLNWQNEVEKLKTDTGQKIENRKTELGKIMDNFRIDTMSGSFPKRLGNDERDSLRSTKNRLREILKFL